MEKGPANSPQTNGLAEQFNQTLLVKIRCMLAQCSIPLNYWDEAAKFASTLINMLPSLSLNWKSPESILVKHSSAIEQVRHVQTLLPFGLKVYVHNQTPSSKALPPSKPLLFLGYEPRSDAMRFLDPISRRIVISQDFTPSILSFPYKSSDAMMKLPASLPTSSALTKDQYVVVSLPKDTTKSTTIPPISISNTSASTTTHLTSTPSHPSNPRSTHSVSSIPRSTPSLNLQERSNLSSPSQQPRSTPRERPAPKAITADIVPSNIIEGSRRKDKDLPDLNIVLDQEFPNLNLTEAVTINDAMNDTKFLPAWNTAMTSEFSSLQSQNMGLLVPPPSDDKIIGGMWLLTHKKNEFGEIVRHKA